jgi:hypothetical protein
MDREYKVGTVLIILGILIPLLSLPFMTGYEHGKGIIDNLFSLGIPVKTESPKTQGAAGPEGKGKEPGAKLKITWDMVTPERFPFRFILAFGIFLMFVGFVRIDSERRKKQKQPGENT